MDPRIERSRADLVAAARSLLLAKGLAGVTHLEVARRSGLGRKTVYRHFPDRSALLHATLSTAEFPRAEPIGDLRADLSGHLRALAAALTEGPLAFVVATLVEGAAVDPELADLRARLASEGCRPLQDLLAAARARGEIDVELEDAQAELEGPLFYAALVAPKPWAIDIDALVDRFLARVARPGGAGLAPSVPRVGRGRGRGASASRSRRGARDPGRGRP